VQLPIYKFNVAGAGRNHRIAKTLRRNNMIMLFDSAVLGGADTPSNIRRQMIANDR
jgi:hypothetical protein